MSEMAIKQISLKELQGAIAREREKAKTFEERRELERELRELRAGQSTKLLKRLGRGFVILTKKTAVAAGKGAKTIQEFGEKRGAGQFFETEFSGPAGAIRRERIVRAAPGKRKIKIVRARMKPMTRQVFVRGPGVVTQKVKQKAVRRIVRAKPKRRRKIVRRRAAQNTGFFESFRPVGI